MAIEFQCPDCGRQLRAADDAVGKNARCPRCSKLFPITVAPGAAPAPAAPVEAAPAEAAAAEPAQPEGVDQGPMIVTTGPAVQTGGPTPRPAARGGTPAAKPAARPTAASAAKTTAPGKKGSAAKQPAAKKRGFNPATVGKIVLLDAIVVVAIVVWWWKGGHSARVIPIGLPMVLVGLFGLAAALFHWSLLFGKPDRPGMLDKLIGRTTTRCIYGALGAGLCLMGTLYLGQIIGGQRAPAKKPAAAVQSPGPAAGSYQPPAETPKPNPTKPKKPSGKPGKKPNPKK